jgi:acyl-CoA thioesterase FadM
MCVAEQTLVFIDVAARRPAPVPERYRAPVRAFEGADLEEAA